MAEALSEIAPKISAASHLQEIARQKNQKAEREKQIVDEGESFVRRSRCMKSISVAPYFRARAISHKRMHGQILARPFFQNKDAGRVQAKPEFFALQK